MPAVKSSTMPIDETANGPIDFTTGAVDFSTVETTFKPKPNGDYPGIIVDAEVRTGKDSGKDYVSATVDLDDGGKCWPILSFSEGALMRTKKSLVALGVDLSQPMTPDMVAEAIKNLRCVCRLKTRKYTNEDGETVESNTVSDVFGPDHVSATGAAGNSSW